MTRLSIGLAAVIFLLVAVAHAYRLYAGWSVVIHGHDVPMWVSWPGMLIPGFLAFVLFSEARR